MKSRLRQWRKSEARPTFWMFDCELVAIILDSKRLGGKIKLHSFRFSRRDRHMLKSFECADRLGRAGSLKANVEFDGFLRRTRSGIPHISFGGHCRYSRLQTLVEFRGVQLVRTDRGWTVRKSRIGEAEAKG